MSKKPVQKNKETDSSKTKIKDIDIAAFIEQYATKRRTEKSLSDKDKPETKRPDTEQLRSHEELRELQLNNKDKELDQELKREIFGWVKVIVTCYLIFIALIIVSITFSIGKLSDSALIALLTTTTINIIGLPYLIISSLFGNKKKRRKKRQKKKKSDNQISK